MKLNLRTPVMCFVLLFCLFGLSKSGFAQPANYVYTFYDGANGTGNVMATYTGPLPTTSYVSTDGVVLDPANLGGTIIPTVTPTRLQPCSLTTVQNSTFTYLACYGEGFGEGTLFVILTGGSVPIPTTIGTYNTVTTTEFGLPSEIATFDSNNNTNGESKPIASFTIALAVSSANSQLTTLLTQIDNSISGGTKIDHLELKEASAQLSAALNAKNWTGTDGNHLNRNNAVQFFLEEGVVTVDLTLLLNNKHSAIAHQVIQTCLDELMSANRLLAITAISDAVGKNARVLAQANSDVAAGDEAIVAGQYAAAFTAYVAAWSLTEIAL